MLHRNLNVAVAAAILEHGHQHVWSQRVGWYLVEDRRQDVGAIQPEWTVDVAAVDVEGDSQGERQGLGDDLAVPRVEADLALTGDDGGSRFGMAKQQLMSSASNWPSPSTCKIQSAPVSSARR